MLLELIFNVPLRNVPYICRDNILTPWAPVRAKNKLRELRRRRSPVTDLRKKDEELSTLVTKRTDWQTDTDCDSLSSWRSPSPEYKDFFPTLLSYGLPSTPPNDFLQVKDKAWLYRLGSRSNRFSFEFPLLVTHEAICRYESDHGMVLECLIVGH